MLDTIDGAHLAQSVIDARGAKDDLDDLAEKAIGDLLHSRAKGKALRVDLAYVRQDFRALVDDAGVATASLSQEVGVFRDTTAAARADGIGALGEQIIDIVAVTLSQAASLSEINRVEADSASANAREAGHGSPS